MIQGKIYAIDIEPEMLAITQAKAAAAEVHNIELLLRDFVAAGTGLADGSVDYVMLFNILHAEERESMLAEARRVLRPGGKLAIMHWNYDASTPRGPSMSIRPQPSDCRAWAEAAGFKVITPIEIDLPPYHYGWVLSVDR